MTIEIFNTITVVSVNVSQLCLIVSFQKVVCYLRSMLRFMDLSLYQRSREYLQNYLYKKLTLSEAVFATELSEDSPKSTQLE
jgi:hypothetical protein